MSIRQPQVHLVADVEVTVENWSDDYVRQWVLCHKGEPVRDNGVVIKEETRRQLLRRMTSNRSMAAIKAAACTHRLAPQAQAIEGSKPAR